MARASNYVEMTLYIPELAGESLLVSAPCSAKLVDIVEHVQRRLAALCGVESCDADFKLASRGELVQLDDPRPLQDFAHGFPNRIEMNLFLVHLDTLSNAYSAQRRADCKVCWEIASKRISQEFELDGSLICRQLQVSQHDETRVSSQSPCSEITDEILRSGDADKSYVTVTFLSGASRQIIVGGHFDTVQLQDLLSQIESECAIPSGWAELLWNSKRFGPEDLHQTLQDLGLGQGDKLLCVERLSCFVTFLAHLNIDLAHEDCLGDKTQWLIKCHVLSPLGASASLSIELWADLWVSHGYTISNAQILWLMDCQDPTCLLQIATDELANQYDVFQAAFDVLDVLAVALGLPSGTEALRALSCVGLPEFVQACIAQRQMSNFGQSTAHDQPLWEPLLKFDGTRPPHSVFVASPTPTMLLAERQREAIACRPACGWRFVRSLVDSLETTGTQKYAKIQQRFRNDPCAHYAVTEQLGQLAATLPHTFRVRKGCLGLAVAEEHVFGCGARNCENCVCYKLCLPLAGDAGEAAEDPDDTYSN